MCPFSIHLYLCLSLCQSKFTSISINPVFFITVYSSYIHLYFFSISCLFTSISWYLSIQIDAYFSSYPFANPNSRLHLSTPFSLSKSNHHLSTCIYFYLFSIHHTISFYLLFTQIYIFLPIQIHGFIFICSSLYFKISLIYLSLSLSISFIPLCQSRLLPITFYLFVNPNSRLYFSNPLSLSKLTTQSFNPVFFISVYSSYIHLYFVSISCLSTSISLYHFVNPDWCLSLSTPFSLFQPNPHLSTCIYFISFLSTILSLSIFCLPKFTYILFNSLLLISAYLSYIDLYFFKSFCQSKLTAISVPVSPRKCHLISKYH